MDSEEGVPFFIFCLVKRRIKPFLITLLVSIVLVGMVMNGPTYRKYDTTGKLEDGALNIQPNPADNTFLGTIMYKALTNVTSDIHKNTIGPVLQFEGRSMNQPTKKTFNDERNVNSTIEQLSTTRISTSIASNRTTFTYNTENTNTSKINNTDWCKKEFKLRHMMTSILDGRLGNQLFKLSTLIATANESCFTPFIRPEPILDAVFDIHGVVRKDIDCSNFSKIHEFAWGVYNGSIAEKITAYTNWTITGFRQSFKYFQHKKDIVRASFKFKDTIKKNVERFFANNSLQFKTKIGIHVRRGDFLKVDKIKFGYTSSSVQYIIKAMTYIAARIDTNEFVYVVVSDDIDWCKENLKLAKTVFSPFKDPGRDLYMLTQCDHNIVTTGTYGWMGAWLNETGTVLYDSSYPKWHSTLWHGHIKDHYYPDWWVGL